MTTTPPSKEVRIDLDLLATLLILGAQSHFARVAERARFAGDAGAVNTALGGSALAREYGEAIRTATKFHLEGFRCPEDDDAPPTKRDQLIAFIDLKGNAYIDALGKDD